MKHILFSALFLLFAQPCFSIPIKIDFSNALVSVTDPLGVAPGGVGDLIQGYLIFDSETPDSDSTSIPQGTSTDEFGLFNNSIIDIFITLNGLDFHLDNAFSNSIETASFAGSEVNFDFRAIAKITHADTILDFVFSTAGDGLRAGSIPDPKDSLPSAGDDAGGSSFISLSNAVDGYSMITGERVGGEFYEVPEPGLVFLLGASLMGLVASLRRKRNA